jgi:acetolactate synthase regulatory subunit
MIQALSAKSQTESFQHGLDFTISGSSKTAPSLDILSSQLHKVSDIFKIVSLDAIHYTYGEA